MIRVLLFALLACVCFGCAEQREHVVLYTSQDQFYAEPILKLFTETTGIEVRPVFDTESAKTAALAHRLRAEKSNPQCDVFWSNEEMHTRLLVRDGVIASNEWKAVGYRTRRVVINTNLVHLSQAPRSLLELTQRHWNGKVALAYPLFGTTSFHMLALRQAWGDGVWREWCSGLLRNGAKVVDGNSLVVKLVGTGESWIGLTDSDDIAAGQRQGLPVAALPFIEEALVIPNTISIVTGSPRRNSAEKLVAFLGDVETLRRLVAIGALEGIESGDVRSLKVDWSRPDVNLDELNEVLKLIFLRS